MWQKISYKRVRRGVVNIDNYGHCSYREYRVSPGPYLGKDAYYNEDDSDEIKYRLSYDTVIPTPTGNQKVYVANNCRLPRALLRGSDYKIVLDPDKANYIIAPFPGENITKHEFQIASFDSSEETLMMWSISKAYGTQDTSEKMIEDVLDCIKRSIGKYNLQFIYFGMLETHVMSFLKKSDVYLDMLNRKRVSFSSGSFYGFIYDSEVRYTPTNIIDIDFLEFIKRCNEQDVVEKAVVGSNWKEYPLSLCTALYMRSNKYARGSAFKLVQETIHFETFWVYDGRWEHNPIVSANDWNLCQRWLMRCNGVDEEKGGVTQYDGGTYGRKNDLARYIRKRTLIKPYFIEDDTPYNDLMEAARI